MPQLAELGRDGVHAEGGAPVVGFSKEILVVGAAIGANLPQILKTRWFSSVSSLISAYIR
jgi:hypothetical protein